jgi:hypothetical protein
VWQPTITPAEAGLEPGEMQVDEERALCLYVRALSDERVPASRCFAALSPFPPPPPPMPRSALAAISTALRRRKVRRGGSSGPDPEPSLDEEQEFVREHTEQHERVNALLDRLSLENFQLRDTLADIRAKLQPEGRRLFERLPGVGSHRLADNVKLTPLSVGGGAVLGLSVAQCATLCTALANATEPLHACQGIAYRMLEPGNAASLQTAYCFLLRTIGSCTAMDFGAAIYLRRDTSSCHTPTAQDNPMCVQMAPDRADMRVLDYAAAKASCRQGKGAPRLPRPRSSLEVLLQSHQTCTHTTAHLTAQPDCTPGAGRLSPWLRTRASGACTPSGRRSRCARTAPRASARTGAGSTASPSSWRRATSGASWWPPRTTTSTATCLRAWSPATRASPTAWSARAGRPRRKSSLL